MIAILASVPIVRNKKKSLEMLVAFVCSARSMYLSYFWNISNE